MKKILAGILAMGSLTFAQMFGDETIKEFGFKVGIASVKYDSVDNSKPSKTLDEFISAYGYMGARTASGFTAGAALELATGSKMSGDRTIIYNALELNPSVEIEFSDRLRAFTGFGGSVNRFKERSGTITNKETNFGLQFFVGAKYNLTATVGVLGEYKGKIFMTGDYSGNVIHHFNLGLYFLAF